MQTTDAAALLHVNVVHQQIDLQAMCSFVHVDKARRPHTHTHTHTASLTHMQEDLESRSPVAVLCTEISAKSSD
jgi:hypothetical protein